jgi:hypothetical protein
MDLLPADDLIALYRKQSAALHCLLSLLCHRMSVRPVACVAYTGVVDCCGQDLDVSGQICVGAVLV